MGKKIFQGHGCLFQRGGRNCLPIITWEIGPDPWPIQGWSATGPCPPTPLGLVSVPRYPFLEQKADFTFVSLLTRSEVITALSKVRAECNKVTTMSLFHSSLSKYSRLEEFEQIQSQTFSQVRGHPGDGGRQQARASELLDTDRGPEKPGSPSAESSCFP